MYSYTTVREMKLCIRTNGYIYLQSYGSARWREFMGWWRGIGASKTQQGRRHLQTRDN